MKQSKIFFAIIVYASLLLFSCNGNNTTNAGKDSTSTSSSAVNTSSSTGDAVFSYNLDGTKISGGEVDATQTNNIAMIIKNDKGEKFSFFLGDAYQQNTETFAHSLRFTIPGKIGMVTLQPDDDNGTVELFLGNSQDDKYIIYGNEAFNVTVTNISANRVSGTFSGKLKIAEGQPSGKPELTVTDGKFNIPVRNYQ